MKRQHLWFLVALFFVVASNSSCGGGLQYSAKSLSPKQQGKVDAHPLGSLKNPIRCDGPQGQRAYLSRLRCPNGAPPNFNRGGSVGVGPYGTVLDVYQVRSSDPDSTTDIYMDMYHHEGYVETRPVEGFDIVPPQPPSEEATRRTTSR